jgi:hypothetical protein
MGGRQGVTQYNHDKVVEMAHMLAEVCHYSPRTYGPVTRDIGAELTRIFPVII